MRSKSLTHSRRIYDRNSRPSSYAIYNDQSSAESLHESDETNDSDVESFWSDYLESSEGNPFVLRLIRG